MYSALIRLVGWSEIVVIGVLSLLPGDMRPHRGPEIPGQLAHFLAYFMTAGVLALGYRARAHAVKITLWLTLYAALLEIAQLWIPGRISRLIDFGASALGVLAGIGVVLLTGIRRPTDEQSSGGAWRSRPTKGPPR